MRVETDVVLVVFCRISVIDIYLIEHQHNIGYIYLQPNFVKIDKHFLDGRTLRSALLGRLGGVMT